MKHDRTRLALLVMSVITLAALSALSYQAFTQQDRADTATAAAETVAGSATDLADQVQAACGAGDAEAARLDGLGLCAAASETQQVVEDAPVDPTPAVRDGKDGRDGIDGQTPTLELLRSLVAEALNLNCGGSCRGEDAQPPSVELLQAIAAQALAEQCGDTCEGKDGQTISGPPGRGIADLPCVDGRFVLVFDDGTSRATNASCTPVDETPAPTPTPTPTPDPTPTTGAPL